MVFERDRFGLKSCIFISVSVWVKLFIMSALWQAIQRRQQKETLDKHIHFFISLYSISTCTCFLWVTMQMKTCPKRRAVVVQMILKSSVFCSGVKIATSKTICGGNHEVVQFSQIPQNFFLHISQAIQISERGDRRSSHFL